MTEVAIDIVIKQHTNLLLSFYIDFIIENIIYKNIWWSRIDKSRYQEIE